MRVAVIPALDEAGSIGAVVDHLQPHVDAVVVVDNGSRDRTAAVAASHGALVEAEPRRGYGAACLRGIARAVALDASLIIFLDADGSDDPDDAQRLLAAVAEGADLALGIRTRQTTEPGAMTGPQRFGNWFAPLLMRLVVGARYNDMPPFKVIRREALERLKLTDTGHGFTIELLLRAHQVGLRVQEVEVACRRRSAGESKVSGTLSGTVRAAAKILTTVARHAVLARERTMKPEPWKTLSSKLIYENKWMRLREDVAELPDKRTTLYGVVTFGDCVGVVPFVDEAHITLVRQYRYVFGENHRWEIPTGGVRPGETFEQAAQRELAEEAGYRAGRLSPICSYYTSKSVCDETAHLYLGESLTPSHEPPDETEFLERRVFSFEQALQMTLEGEIMDSMSVIGITLAARRLGV